MNANVPDSVVLARPVSPSGDGRISLVGAGPGDPDLLTVRAVRRLAEADVVIYDNLVSEQILDLIPHGIRRIYAGKETSNHSLPQDEITALLVRHARLGQRVVRLKGGDPFVFGRGGEELHDIAAHGIPVEVVPGITAALGAGAGTGIPLTHRDFAQSCVFVTGHRKADSPDLDWPALARPGQTIVIYMGIAELSRISAQLIGHGLAAETPVALVRHASRHDQETVVGTLADIAEKAVREDIRPPALIIVGAVVTLYDKDLAARLREFTASHVISSPA